MTRIFKNRFFQLILILATGIFLGWMIFHGDNTEEYIHSDEVGLETVWTCSMHPQIRQSEPGKCPLCGMNLIPLTKQNEPGSHTSPFVYTMSHEAIALANVQTSKVGYVTPEHEIYLTGKIAVNEQKLAVITANYSGRIEKLFVDFTGQTVSKDRKLATIYSPELITAQKELLEAAKYKQVNPVLHNAAREKMRLWKISEKQLDDIEASGEVMTEFDMYADISGIVLSRNVSTGDYVNRGSVLFEIADLSTVWLLMDAYESDLSLVKIGEKVVFTVASVPGKEFTSTVTFIDLLINPQTRAASVRAEAANPRFELKPEMFVKAKIKARLSNTEKSLLIPKTSILWTGKRSVAYVKVPESEFPAFEMREVTLGPHAGDFYVVESGLQAGEDVVTNGVFAIDAAAQLSGNYSMMSRPVSKRIPVPEKFKSQLSEFTNQYFNWKNALVESDFADSKKSAGKLLQSLQSVDMKLLDDKAHQFWMEQERPLRKTIELLSKAENIEEQRTHFAVVSNALIEVAEIFGLTIDTVYVDYCPMALNDKGAFWLSEFEEIKNPYFGDAMLQCGEVKKMIRRVESYGEEPLRKPQEGHQH